MLATTMIIMKIPDSQNASTELSYNQFFRNSHDFAKSLDLHMLVWNKISVALGQL